jgi:hypothetical protein
MRGSSLMSMLGPQVSNIVEEEVVVVVVVVCVCVCVCVCGCL